MSEPSREALEAARRAFPGLTCDGTGAEHEPFSSKRCGLCWTALTLDAFADARVREAYEKAAVICDQEADEYDTEERCAYDFRTAELCGARKSEALACAAAIRALAPEGRAT